MRFIPLWLRRALAPFTWNARDRDMEQEMAFHIESLTRELVRSGMDEAEAGRAARRRFGDRQRLKEQGHDVRTAPLVEHLLRDTNYALRGIRRTPAFAMTVILTLAVGIGGNTAIFSVVDQVLLRPLPYPAGDRLVTIYEAGSSSPRDHFSVSPANWLDWQRDSRTFQGFAAWTTFSSTLTGVGEPVRVRTQLVSAEFFPLLGVRPLLGRTIAEDDDRPDAPLVAVLSYDMWQRQFGGNPQVIGRSVQFDDRAVEIIGVMPGGFRFVYPDNDAWAAFRLDRNRPWRDTAGRFLRVIGRTQDSVPLAEARTEMQMIAQRLAAAHAFNRNTTVDLVPLREELIGPVQTSLWVLYGAVAVLLSIACFNVANLLLARAASRQREIAIRTSLGAARSTIVRQLLVESLLLALVGGALGTALAMWSLGALVAFAPPDLLRVPELSVDRRVLLYALAVSTLTGLAVGLVPALLVGGRSITASLRASGPGVTHSARLRQVLVVCQVALTVILLCVAGLLVRTMLALERTSSGFDKQGILTMEVGLPGSRYAPDARVDFYREAVARLRALPGVESAAAANSLPVIGSPRGGTVFHRLGTPELPVDERPVATIRVVTPGWFRTLGIPVRRGREFTDADLANPATGFIVNEAFARAYLQDIDPLQASLSVWMEQENPHLPVIGVVGNVSEGSVREDARPTVFYSHRRLTETGMTLFVRARAPEALAKAAVAAVHDIDPNLAVTRIRTLETALAESLARERLNALVSGTFALSGLLLASLGLYGLLAFLVAERTKELGIRIALGESLAQLVRSVVARGLRLVGAGAALGVGGALLLLRSFEDLLFGVTVHDLTTYATVLALLGLVAALACYVPARRAARVEPLAVLRHE